MVLRLTPHRLPVTCCSEFTKVAADCVLFYDFCRTVTREDFPGPMRSVNNEKNKMIY